jgi:hypothetical protein
MAFTEQLRGLLLKDEQGEYYLIGREAIETARLPPDRKAEIDALVSEPEAQGFAAVNPCLIPIVGQAHCYAWAVTDILRKETRK